MYPTFPLVKLNMAAIQPPALYIFQSVDVRKEAMSADEKEYRSRDRILAIRICIRRKAGGCDFAPKTVAADKDQMDGHGPSRYSSWAGRNCRTS